MSDDARDAGMIARYEIQCQSMSCRQSLATRPTLRECQILAHDTARLWVGESTDD